MAILVANDDGVFADGLWAMVRELKAIDEIIVAAPDREQSAIGTAVTLIHPLRVRKARPVVEDVDTWAVEGTPGDSVILALQKFAQGRIDMVVSGINQGLNVGTDVLISGTVGAALQGYLRGFPAIAVSAAQSDAAYLRSVARFVVALAGRMRAHPQPIIPFFNINVPDLPVSNIKGVKITRLATQSHIDTVEEGHDGKRHYYWLVRKRVLQNAEEMTDIWAVDQGYISITPLHGIISSEMPVIADGFSDELLTELQKSESQR